MMPANSEIIHNMLLHIADFFYYMSNNKEQRLYYVIPIRHHSPYAYQHSTIRDVATVCDILDLIQFFKTEKISISPDTMPLFETVTRNTLLAYHDLYQSGNLSHFSEGNIGDLGFFLLLLQKCHHIFPSILPNNWKITRSKLIKQLLERQNDDGSMRIFFDINLEQYAKSSEAFYLPEALIGLLACIEKDGEQKSQMIQIEKTVAYCCQEKLRQQNFESDTATFYANWQFQLLFHWVKVSKKLGNNKFSLEEQHLKRLIDMLQNSRIVHEMFGSGIATVEVACYMEGLAHAKNILKALNLYINRYEEWMEKEIDRSLQFLYEVQTKHLPLIKGGFVHSLHSDEARIDVAGHVFNGLCLIKT